MSEVFVSGPFDNLRSAQIRFLVEAARLGTLRVLLWPDSLVERLTGSAPRFGFEERRYFLGSLRAVDAVLEAPADLDPDRPIFPAASARARLQTAASRGDGSMLGPATHAAGGAGAGGADAGGGSGRPSAEGSAERLSRAGRPVWALAEPAAGSAAGALADRAEAPAQAKRAWCAQNGIAYRVLGRVELEGFPYEPLPADAPRARGAKRVVVTGCFDWLHSGHVRFFEEASAYGELNVVIGSDANVRLLKGEGHPMIGELERRFVVGSMRAVKRCLVSSGSGWMDAEPEIRELGIERYVVNEDGDKSDKRRYCEERGIEYIVLRRVPKEGLPRRASTDLRGF